MELFDVLIVGSGPAGVAAALACEGRRTLVIDAGIPAPPPPDLEGNLYELRRLREDMSDALVGESFESLRNLYRPPISLKLKSPAMSYIVRDAEDLSPVRTESFDATMSFAAGGLANGWGAGVFRFNARDLEGFPIGPADLEPWYDVLSRHIGIDGENDDLAASFGEEPELQPAPELSRFASDLLAGYGRERAWFRKKGIAIGRPRLAVLTREHRGRAPYQYGNLEFFRPRDPAVYNPAFTLEELVAARRIEYAPGRLALRFAETGDAVEVTTRNIATGAHETFRGRALILAAGAINSGKLALASNGDHSARLPLMDNPMVCLPLFRPRLVGEALDRRDSSIGQLVVLFEHRGALVQGSIYGAAGPLRSDVLFELPLSVSANLSTLRRLSAATGLLMLFYPDEPAAGNGIRLASDGALEIDYRQPLLNGAETALIPAFRRLGFYTARFLRQYPRPGAAIHYAGTLPMRREPGPYETHPDGLLHGTSRVYVADGACFPRLPAKNLTFTIMANAMRIASGIPR